MGRYWRRGLWKQKSTFSNEGIYFTVGYICRWRTSNQQDLLSGKTSLKIKETEWARGGGGGAGSVKGVPGPREMYFQSLYNNLPSNNVVVFSYSPYNFLTSTDNDGIECVGQKEHNQLNWFGRHIHWVIINLGRKIRRKNYIRLK